MGYRLNRLDEPIFMAQCQNPCRLSLAFIMDWRVVASLFKSFCCYFKDYIGSRGTSRRSSTVSAASIFLELHSPGGSTASSPGPHRAQAAAETDFKAFKRILEAIPQQVCQHFPSQIVLKRFSTISERFSLPNLPGRKEMAPFSPPFLVLVSGP